MRDTSQDTLDVLLLNHSAGNIITTLNSCGNEVQDDSGICLKKLSQLFLKYLIVV